MSFKVGELVQLRAGGPSMVVQEVNDETVTCRWFNKSKLENACFTGAELQSPNQPLISTEMLGVRPEFATVK